MEITKNIIEYLAYNVDKETIKSFVYQWKKKCAPVKRIQGKLEKNHSPWLDKSINHFVYFPYGWQDKCFRNGSASGQVMRWVRQNFSSIRNIKKRPGVTGSCRICRKNNMKVYVGGQRKKVCRKCFHSINILLLKR